MLKTLAALTILGSTLLVSPVVGHGFKGVVCDIEGKPLADAWVEARKVRHGALTALDFEGAPEISMRTRADGRWSVHGLDAGTWLITAVVSDTPRSDQEMQDLARPRDDGYIPDGVAITRLIRRFGRVFGWRTEMLDLGLAVGSSTDKPFKGRLTGAFDPDRFGYEIQLSLHRPTRAGSRNPVTVSASDINPRFSTVPNTDGSFDFGGIPFGEYDFVWAECFPLQGDDVAMPTTLIHSQRLTLKAEEDGSYAIQVPSVGDAVFRASGGEQKGDDRIRYSLWSERGGSSTWYVKPPFPSSRRVLPDGTYLARAILGDYSSPLTTFRVESSEGTTEVVLPLLSCKPFTVKMINQIGAHLGTKFLRIGTEESSAFPEPCRVQAFLQDGKVELKGILPGFYDVEFRTGREESFIRRLELRPSIPVVVVDVPNPLGR